GHELIPLDTNRAFRLQHLDRNVGDIAQAPGAAVLTIPVRTAATAGDVVELQHQEGLGILVVAGEDQGELAAADARRHAVRQDLRQRPGHRRAYAIPAQAARTDRRREARVEEAPLRDNGPHAAI